MRPLDGISVLDFSTLLPGPMATLLLAEAGADVTKVERPDQGEDMRSYAPMWRGEGINFALLNRGKKSLAVDLKAAEGRARIYDLVRRVDVLVEQFRPGVMSRLGLGFEELLSINPRLIYCSITGYGQTGPKSKVAGHDLNYIGDTGLLGLSMGDPVRPTVPPALIADIAGGAYPAVINILLALEERRRTGAGRHLDIAMSDNMFPFMYWAIGTGLATNRWPGNGTDLVTGGTPRYRLYRTSDGEVLAAAPIEEKFWEAFCEVIDLDAPLREDFINPHATIRRIEQIIASKEASYWAPRFAQADCCCTIVKDLQSAICDPHFAARGVFDHKLQGKAGEVISALPVPLDPAFRGPPDLPLRAPSLGDSG